MVVRQPNELLCICNWNGVIEKYNLTEEQYIEYSAQKAREWISNKDNINHFSEMIKGEKVTDEQLKEMGFDKSLKELLIYISKKPINTSYCERDCCTYGKCPNCGNVVQNGMGGTDDKCSKCGQILKW